MAVSAPSRRKPGCGFAPWLMGSPSRRPLGVAPTSLPSTIVLDQENQPGMNLTGAKTSSMALTWSVKEALMRLAQWSPSVSPPP